jgi:callose synthase
LQVYAVSWIVVVAFLILLKIVSFGRKRFSADFQLMFRLVKALAFIAAVATLSLCLVFTRLTFRDLFSSILAFVPTGWGLLSVSVFATFHYLSILSSLWFMRR